MDWIFGLLKAGNPHQSKLRILELEVFVRDASAETLLKGIDSVMGAEFPALESVTIKANIGDWEGSHSFDGTLSARIRNSLPLLTERRVLKVEEHG